MQRFFDILFSGAAITVLSVIFVPIMVLLRFTGEGEVFYLQDRIGRDKKIFKLFKFATMLKNSPNMGTCNITVEGDPRILPMGKFLRKTKINELPQLWNILKGDMSVIGPRPLVPDSFFKYPEEIQEIIGQVRPGLSGIGSIVFRDEEKILSNVTSDRVVFYNDIILPYKGALEEWYVKNRSLKLYFLLIFLTIWVVLFPQKTDITEKLLPDLPKKPEALSMSM